MCRWFDSNSWGFRDSSDGRATYLLSNFFKTFLSAKRKILTKLFTNVGSNPTFRITKMVKLVYTKVWRTFKENISNLNNKKRFLALLKILIKLLTIILILAHLVRVLVFELMVKILKSNFIWRESSNGRTP